MEGQVGVAVCLQDLVEDTTSRGFDGLCWGGYSIRLRCGGLLEILGLSTKAMCHEKFLGLQVTSFIDLLGGWLRLIRLRTGRFACSLITFQCRQRDQVVSILQVFRPRGTRRASSHPVEQPVVVLFMMTRAERVPLGILGEGLGPLLSLDGRPVFLWIGDVRVGLGGDDRVRRVRVPHEGRSRSCAFGGPPVFRSRRRRAGL